ncbi:MAG: TIGR02647 family protein [Sulfuricella sp.]|nr:TIGR02647 family protein [Sulfuricella sp.]
MLNNPPKLTPELVAELNFLAHYDLDTMQEGIKVHKDADASVINAVQRLFDKKLVTLADGGYLTALGREVAEALQSTLTILTAK